MTSGRLPKQLDLRPRPDPKVNSVSFPARLLAPYKVETINGTAAFRKNVVLLSRKKDSGSVLRKTRDVRGSRLYAVTFESSGHVVLGAGQLD